MSRRNDLLDLKNLQRSDAMELNEAQTGLTAIDKRLAHARLRIAQLNVEVASLLEERVPFSTAIARILARQSAHAEAHFRELAMNPETIN